MLLMVLLASSPEFTLFMVLIASLLLKADASEVYDEKSNNTTAKRMAVIMGMVMCAIAQDIKTMLRACKAGKMLRLCQTGLFKPAFLRNILAKIRDGKTLSTGQVNGVYNVARGWRPFAVLIPDAMSKARQCTRWLQKEVVPDFLPSFSTGETKIGEEANVPAPAPKLRQTTIRDFCSTGETKTEEAHVAVPEPAQQTTAPKVEKREEPVAFRTRSRTRCAARTTRSGRAY